MRRIALALLASIALIGSAAAADMPVKMPVKAPIIVPMYNWTGFYVGLNAGGSWGRQENDLVTVPGGAVLFANTDHLNGFIGGGQIGYNWQTDHWVFGVEGDFQGSGQKADGTFLLPFTIGNFAPSGLTAAYADKLDWFGTIRGRVGYAMGATGNWLPYVTGGWAFGHGTLSGTGTTTPAGTVVAFSTSQDYGGWTIGGGLEWAFMDHWSVKGEYLYIDFGNGPTVIANTAGTLAIVSGRMTDNIARLGINYKF